MERVEWRIQQGLNKNYSTNGELLQWGLHTMKEVLVIYNPKQLLGNSVKVFMKDGGKFYFKVMECGGDFMNGYDEEGMDLHLKIEDIDFVVM